MRAVSVLRHSATYLGASAAFAIVAPAAYAASFDCAKASTGMERLVCGMPPSVPGRDHGEALRGRPEGRQARWGRGAAAKVAEDRSDLQRLSLPGRGLRQAERRTTTVRGRDHRRHGLLQRGAQGQPRDPQRRGPVHGFASVSLSSTYIGAGGEEAGDVFAIGTDALLDLREGRATFSDGPCRLAFAPLNADRWEVTQSGTCELPGGTVFAGVYRRLP